MCVLGVTGQRKTDGWAGPTRLLEHELELLLLPLSPQGQALRSGWRDRGRHGCWSTSWSCCWCRCRHRDKRSAAAGETGADTAAGARAGAAAAASSPQGQALRSGWRDRGRGLASLRPRGRRARGGGRGAVLGTKRATAASASSLKALLPGRGGEEHGDPVLLGIRSRRRSTRSRGSVGS